VNFLKVLLINPPYRTREKKPLGYFNLSTLPLGLGYIAAMLELKGIPSSILDMNILEMNTDELEKRFETDPADIVGITSMTANYESAVKVCKTIKKFHPKTITVLGGVHATFMYEHILKTVPEIDIVVHYEGDVTMSELIKKIEEGGSLSDVKGISYLEEGRIITTPMRERIEDLDKLPYPAYHLYEPSVEEYIEKHQVRAFPILTTRGCPFDCIFCSTAALHGRKYRTRSTANVVEQIEYLKEKYDVNSISFVDDNFTMQQDRVFELCREMEKRDLSISWGCSTRTDMVTPELLKTMKSKGCDNIFFGIESASDKVLKIIRKGTNIEEAAAMVKETEKAGIKTHCSFILGLPGETPKTLDKIIDFIAETKPTGRVLPNILEILPGTELYEREDEYYLRYKKLHQADITKTQIEMLLKFFELNTNIDKLFRIAPPEIIIK
jgi:radical SAM superfamily enzyme YgiQ (UPF0313 family)